MRGLYSQAKERGNVLCTDTPSPNRHPEIPTKELIQQIEGLAPQTRCIRRPYCHTIWALASTANPDGGPESYWVHASMDYVR